MLVSTVVSREQLCFDLKTAEHHNDVTLDGRVFHTCAATTGKARPPMVAQWTRGMMRSAVDAERSRCRLSVSTSMSTRHQE